MGKIKTKLIKRTANALLGKDLPFAEEFISNKKILGREMPSKKIRNQLAGYLSRLKKQHRIEAERLAVKKQ